MLSFLKSEKEQETARIKKEIKSTELKKTSMISAVTSEKTELEKQRTTCFTKIGADAFALHKSGSTNYDFSAIFQQIDDLEGQMLEKDKKIQELAVRYDEEISLLTASIPAEEVQATSVAPTTATPAFCEKCGTKSSEGDTFCQNCGNKMC